LGPAVPIGAGLDDVAGGPSGAGPLTTPGITTTGCCGGSGIDGVALTAGAGPTGPDLPCNGADVSVTPPASGGGAFELLGPGAVDSPITGPITGGCVAGREHAPALHAIAISAARRVSWAMAPRRASRVPRAPWCICEPCAEGAPCATARRHSPDARDRRWYAARNPP
jgi:hypothetical protein